MAEKVKMRSKKGSGLVVQIILHTVMIVSLIMVLYPLAMMVFGAFKSGTEFSHNKWMPALPLRIANISESFSVLKGSLVRTAIVALLGIGGMVVISSMAAFAMAKLKFVGSKLCFSMVLALTMMPGILSMTPQLILYQEIFGLRNNLLALILPMWTGGCVFGVFLLSGFYGGMPNEFFEAASLDGANEIQRYWLIAVPMSLPIIATMVIMQITNVWNDLIWPQMIMDRSNYTLAATLAVVFDELYKDDGAETVKFAGYLVSSIPVVLLFIYFNRFYVEGLASSGIKL